MHGGLTSLQPVETGGGASGGTVGGAEAVDGDGSRARCSTITAPTPVAEVIDGVGPLGGGTLRGGETRGG